MTGRDEGMLVVHHIGARGETQALPPLPAFDQDVINVLVDADADSSEETRRLNDGRSARVIVLAACLAGANGVRTFRHARSPYASSLLPPDPNIGEAYLAAHWVDHDYTLGDALATSRTEQVNATTLDVLVEQSARIPLPDYLSLDTQGSELEILQGSPRSLAAALAVVTEVEFVELYDRQPLFGEVARFLSDAGFVLCGFGDVHAGSYYRAPVGLRARQMPVTTDAVFLRRPDTVTVDPERRLRALAFFALIHGHLEHGQWALSRLPAESTPSRNPASWWCFVDEFRGLAGRFPQLFPDRFAGDPDTTRTPFAERLAAARADIERSLAEMGAFWDRYGLTAIGDLQRERYAAILRQYGIDS